MARAELVVADLARRQGFTLQRVQNGYRLQSRCGGDLHCFSLGTALDRILEATPMTAAEPKRSGRKLGWMRFA